MIYPYLSIRQPIMRQIARGIAAVTLQPIGRSVRAYSPVLPEAGLAHTPNYI